MVSTHQQYLRPDLLNSTPPSTMDSSPLALLAQTCNAIGLPDPPATGNVKSANAKSSKNDSKDSKDESKMASSSSHKNHSNSSTRPESASESSTAIDRRSASSAHSDNPRKTENRSRNSVGHSSTDSKTVTTSSERAESAPKAPVSTASSTTAPLGNKCNTINSGNPITFPTNYPPALFPPYFPSTSTAGSASFPFAPPPHLPPLPLTAGACFPSFPTTAPGASWLASPPSSLPGFPPKCSDPFCKTCPAIAAAAAVRVGTGPGACGAMGCPCAQFGGANAHQDLSSFWLSYGSLFGLHGGAANPVSVATNPLLAAAASAYAASATSSASGSSIGQQHTCSWMTGNEFCGKRFSTSEELLQHLRTHTSQESAKAPLTVPTGPIPVSMPTVPGRLSPRATSYLNTLNSFRFHPYTPNKFSPSSSAAAAAAALASLQFPPTAFNPQAFCGSLTSQRLPGTLPHP